jgi:hypothetical protein
MNRRFDLGLFDFRERRVQINLNGESFMQVAASHNRKRPSYNALRLKP